MIAYFETSALIKLFIQEPGSELAARTWDAMDSRLSSRLTYAEARASLATAVRAGRLSDSSFRSAKDQLEGRFQQVDVIEVTESLAREAGRLAESLALRAYDAVHLASALVLGTTDLVLVTWDRDLIRASGSVGLDVASG